MEHQNVAFTTDTQEADAIPSSMDEVAILEELYDLQTEIENIFMQIDDDKHSMDARGVEWQRKAAGARRWKIIRARMLQRECVRRDIKSGMTLPGELTDLPVSDASIGRNAAFVAACEDKYSGAEMKRLWVMAQTIDPGAFV